MAALAMALVALVAWAMVTVPSMALVAVVMAVATFILLSIGHTGPLDVSNIFYYPLTTF